MSSLTSSEVDTHNWKNVQIWVDWWRRPQVLKKICKAYSSLTPDEWDDLSGTTNAVESINRQSIPTNVKAVSLKPLIEHFYLEDRRQAILQLASDANVTISHHVKQRRRSGQPAKAPEKSSTLTTVPSGKRAIGT